MDQDLHESKLFIRNQDGTRSLASEEFEYTPLHEQEDQVRLITLYPTDGDVNQKANYVRCEMETFPLSSAPSFVAIKNTRGYRLIEEAIEINGHPLLVAVALERFLRNFRSLIDKPTLLWSRHLCVILSDGQEKERYWTREHSDRMYELATEVVEMDVFNADLRDRKVIEKVIDGRYASWNKQWWGVPQEVVLPRVCPIRLGSRASIEAPTDPFTYVPLDSVTDEIRIMVLLGSEDDSAPIVIHVAHCPIKCDATIVALSYTWGMDDSTPCEIIMNGLKKYVRRSLHDALLAIRMRDKAVPVWVDALSINQDDIVERSRQVPRMGQIFDNAMNVLCYTGSASNDSDMAVELVAELRKHPMMRFNDKREWHFGEWGKEGDVWWYGENRIPPERLGPMLAALYKYLTRPYFRRAWVLQEVAWASNPTVSMTGKFDTSFEKLDHAVYSLEDMLRHDPTLPGLIMNTDPTLEVDVDQLAFARKLFYFRHVISKGAREHDMGLKFSNIKEGSPGLLETLILGRDFESRDPRDKIFSLWNLAQDKDGLEFSADYTRSVRDTYTQFGRAWIQQHRTLDILGAAEAVSRSSAFYETEPSWAPNWEVSSAASCLVRRERIPTTLMFALDDQDGKLYNTDGGMNRDSFETPLFEFDGDVLCCTGVILDQIKFMFEEPGEIPENMLFPMCDPPSYHKFRHWTEEVEKYYSSKGLTTYHDATQAATAMFHGDSAAAWPLRADNLENWDERSDETYVCIPAMTRHVPWYGGSYNRTVAWDAVKTVLRGRRPFVSENGYMGLMPAYLEENTSNSTLHLAVVACCSVPLLLRERTDGSYRLVGTCFVQGWMDGEVMEVMMGAESPREFWQAVQEDAKIRIS